MLVSCCFSMLFPIAQQTFFEDKKCALYLFCIPYGFYHFAANIKVLNAYLK